MKKYKNIAISMGDINGIGVKLALQSHAKIKKFCNPIYLIDKKTLKHSAKLQNLTIPKDFKTLKIGYKPTISPRHATKDSGKFSYLSFLKAIELAVEKKVDAIVTLPINKNAWKKANINYNGHTDMLRDYFNKNAIMMMGNKKLFIALYSEHIALKDVPKTIKLQKLQDFFIDFINSTKAKKIGVLALNPHASDNGVMGNEEKKIHKAIKNVNKLVNKKILIGPLVPDVAWTKKNRKKIKYYIAMYHDQGLIALKSLYFDSSINISLNLPILRVSVGHGTAYDIAYTKTKPNNKSYINAIKYAS